MVVKRSSASTGATVKATPNGKVDEEMLDKLELEALAEQIKPAKTKAKKGKKFADQTYMLSLVDSINKVQEVKIQNSLERTSEALKRLVKRDQSKKLKRETKGDKVAKMKEKLRQKGKSKPTESSLGKNKGDHRKFEKPVKKSNPKSKHDSQKGRKERRVTFAE